MRSIVLGVHGRDAADHDARLRSALPAGAGVESFGRLSVGGTAPTVHAGDVVCALYGDAERGRALAETAAELAHAYATRGAEALELLRCCAAAVLWDRTRAEGMLAVDPLGARPLYVVDDGTHLFFASEIRELLSLLPRTPAPSPIFLAAYLGGDQWPVDTTPYAGVRRLPPGSLIHLADGRREERRYWRPRYVRPRRGVHRTELVHDLRGRLEEAVARRVMPGRTGVLLSGGLDSSSVAAAARDERPHAYSAVFPEHELTDESALLEELTAALRLPWTRVVARRASVIGPSLAYLREWRVPSPVPNLYFTLPLLRAAAADGVAATLDGEGGDELFGCVAWAAADRLRHVDPVGAVRLIRRLPWDGGVQPWRATWHLFERFALRGAIPYPVHSARRRRRRRPGGGPPWLSDEARRTLAAAGEAWSWKRLDGPRWWAFLADTLVEGRVRLGVADVLRRLGDLCGVDRRHPLLDDLDLIEFVLSIPPETAFDPRHSRPLLREAMEGLLPERVRLRVGKAEFRYLVEESFAGPERPLLEQLILAPDARIRSFVDRDAAAEAVARVGDPRAPIFQAALLRMATAECWLRTLEDEDFPLRLAREWELPPADVELVRPS